MISPENEMFFNVDIEQIMKFKPQLVGLRNESLVDELKEALADCDHKPEIIPGEQGVIEVDF